MSSDSTSVLKETLFEGAYIQTAVSAASTGDVLVEGDDSGDVFRLSGGTLYEEVNQILGPGYEAQYQERTVYTTTDTITSIAVDSTDNVYLLDTTKNELLRLTPTSSGYVPSFVATGLTGAVSIGVDAKGNVYALQINGSNGTVEKFTELGTAYAESEFTSGLTSTVGWTGLAVDPSGDVYLQLDAFKITEVQAGTGQLIAIPCLPDGCSLINSGGKYNLTGFVAGPDGNFYLGSFGTIYKVTSGTPGLGTVDVGASATAYLAFQSSVGSAGLSASISGPPFAEYGVGIFSCLGGAIGNSLSPFCYMGVTFAPSGLALYQGTLTLTESSTVSPVPPVKVMLQGTGAAPQIGFSPAPQSIILSGSAPYNLQGPEGIASDAMGNLYLADTAGRQVLKETLSGGQYTQAIVANAQNGLKDPIGVAIDAVGNVYIADPMVGILKETLTASGYTQTTAIAAGGPMGVAVDSNGDLYFPNLASSIVKAVPNGGQYTQTTILSSSNPNTISAAQGIAVDASGNVYVTDTGYQRIIKLSPATGGYTQTIVASGFQYPWGVAVDFSGNVYVGDQGGGVYKETLSNGTYAQALMTGNNLVPYGVAVDGSGNVYAAQDQPARIYEIPAVQTLTLNFASTGVGTTSSDSPQTLTAQNIGMYPLSFSTPGNGSNPSISAGFTIGSASTCPVLTPSSAPAELAPGASCTYLISFTPTTAGAVSGSLTLADNSNNVAGAHQTITLMGTATAAATQSTPVVTVAPSSPSITTTQALSIMVAVSGGSGKPTATGSVVLSSGAYSAQQTLATGSATFNLPAGQLSIGSDTLKATYTPDASSAGIYTTATQSTTVTVTTAVADNPAVTLSPTSLTFASQTDGTASAVMTIMLANSDTAALTVTSIATSGDFAETNNCGTTVAAGAGCAISVTFTPTAPGTRTGTLTITDNASGSPQTVALSGGGETVSVSSNSTGLTIASPGGSSTATIQLSSLGGFTGAVNLTCAVTYQGQGIPNSPPTCSLSPSQAQVTGAASVSTTLTVSTTAPSAVAALDRQWRGVESAFAALVFLGMLPRRRWRGRLLAAVLCLVAISGATGCGPANGGGTNSTSSSTSGTTTGNYQVIVTATSGTASTSTTIPLSLQ